MSETMTFNKAVFLVLDAELGPEDTAEVLNAFLADTRQKIAAIAAAITDRSFVKRETHSIKSSAATFGFERLSKIAREIEACAEFVEPDFLAGCIGRLQGAFNQVSALEEAGLLTGDEGRPA